VRFRTARGGAAAVSVVLAASLVLAACGSSGGSSSSSGSKTSGSTGTSSTAAQSTTGNTASAPGVTPTTITIGQIADISQPVPGLFKSAQVALQAYAAYINDQGGVYGRKLVVDSRDTAFNPATIQSEAADISAHDFAFVGNYTLFDVAAKPAIDAAKIPNIGVPIGDALANDPNTWSPVPSGNNMAALGPFEYFKQTNPAAMQNIGVIYAAATPSAQEAYAVLQKVAADLGLKITYARGFQANETTFDSDVLKMKDAGVKFVWFDGPDNYTATLNREFAQQNFKPISYMSAGYGSNLVKLGGPAVEGVYLPLQTALFLGQDGNAVPVVKTFDKYMARIDPTDSIASWGATSWAAAALFVQALKNAGQNPTRASLETALNKITSFNADGLIATSNPAANVPAACWLLAQVKNGQIVRIPPTPSSGFICKPADQLPLNGFTPSSRVNTTVTS